MGCMTGLYVIYAINALQTEFLNESKYTSQVFLSFPDIYVIWNVLYVSLLFAWPFLTKTVYICASIISMHEYTVFIDDMNLYGSI